MKFFLTMILFFFVNNLLAQKANIDSITYKEWTTMDEPPVIGKDGKYMYYIIQNLPVGGRTLVLQSTTSKWQKECKTLRDDSQPVLGSRHFFFINNNDSLVMLTLGTDNIKHISKVSSFWLGGTKDCEYLIYTPNDNLKTLVLKNLKTDKESSFSDVDGWRFEKNILVLFKSSQRNKSRYFIDLIDLNNGKTTKIWEGCKTENLLIDTKHQQLAFKAGDSVWHYKIGSQKSIFITDLKSSNIDHGLTLGTLDGFSKDGKCIFTSLIQKASIKPKSLKSGMQLWSYTDLNLQTEPITEVNDQRYLAIVNISDRKIICLQQDTKEWLQISPSSDALNNLVLFEKSPLSQPWTMKHKITWSLVSIKNGDRKILKLSDSIGSVSLSPGEKYIIYFDNVNRGYYSYEIATDIVRELTKGIKVIWSDMNGDDRPGALNGNRGPAVWLTNDKSVLVYDRYDIWMLDPLNKEMPVNLTNGYGKRHDIVFNTVFDEVIETETKGKPILYLIASNKKTKDSGFFLKRIDKQGDPELLTMGPYIFHTNRGYVPDSDLDFTPIKAKEADVYLVKRRSANDAPNYFSTKDFKTFNRLSNLQPQKKYNWYKTELHSWKSLDGRTLQGILYKPENFDPNKKYPVIFHYYERKSDGLNSFIKPEPICGGCNIDIPTYVSNGYLVFSPDIYYKIGDPMQGTYDAVISAAGYISNLPFVNEKKMGLQGCSFGGFQTNYLITHTNLFAAAESSSGIANWTSVYGSLMGGESSQHSYYETGQARMGASLWENPEAYIKSSPIFYIDKITTPLLMMHTVDDGICPYSDALAFFTGLRRMGKKAWMLVYPDESHALGIQNHVNDFSTRMMQFFDHYLKDKPAPIWMIDGIPSSRQGLDNGLQLDTKSRTPGPGLLNPEELKKADSLMIRKPVTITLR